ncbi:putative cytochrome c1 heme lyase [Acrodontium crateriforme]|uniref:Holocytochrome c-type synthase n=1 Tax=Acrodontium crateriforme TaxID=150365 RepID=A0AAQ3M549_9PEZI|nr:putative cytochrome c1 heme lyase [Acrodontium crateriforme]
MRPDGADAEAKCPVDHATREKWLEAAKASGQSSPQHPTTTGAIPSSISPTRFSLDSGRWESAKSAKSTSGPRPPKMYRLSNDREISTIPRALPTSSDKPLNDAERAAMPAANREIDTGHDAASGNWIYPSQEMFFNAMKRKGHEAEPADMNSVVPVHNAVNERAWAHIKNWEAGRGSEKCGGPKLVSFAGDSKALTPRARWNSLMGYQTPFDRHDWVVDRCGTRIDYVIDFYSGKDQGIAGKSLNLFLDVRPKLNSWEGIKMRVQRALGLS